VVGSRKIQLCVDDYKLDLPGYNTTISIEDEVSAEQEMAIETLMSFLTLHFLNSVDENIHFVLFRNEGDHGNYLSRSGSEVNG
jgi:hypothetical protein